MVDVYSYVYEGWYDDGCKFWIVVVRAEELIA